MFGDKLVCTENNFSPLDLLNFVASLIKSAKIQERKYDRTNYSWLSSRTIVMSSVEADLEEFKPMVRKLTSENCATIAVKLQKYAEEQKTTSQILREFGNLLEERNRIQMLEGSVKRRGKVGKRQNKVRPVLTPPGRQATVSFIL